jgi:hypothetical protein
MCQPKSSAAVPDADKRSGLQNNASGDNETNYGRAHQIDDGKIKHG